MLMISIRRQGCNVRIRRGPAFWAMGDDAGYISGHKQWAVQSENISTTALLTEDILKMERLAASDCRSDRQVLG